MTEIEPEPTQEFQCERCGYKYNKLRDFKPYLCHRCMRFISKKTWVVVNTIQPPISTTKQGDI